MSSTTSDERSIALKVAPEFQSLSPEFSPAFPNADPRQFVRDGAGPLLLHPPKLVCWQGDKSRAVKCEASGLSAALLNFSIDAPKITFVNTFQSVVAQRSVTDDA